MIITGEGPHKSDHKDINSSGLDSKWLDRAYCFLEEATQLGKISGAAILVAKNGAPMEPRCFG